MRLTERSWKVIRAQSIIQRELDTLQEEHELTDIEMIQTLNQWLANKLKYMLRYERHGDSAKEADIDHPRLEE